MAGFVPPSLTLLWKIVSWKIRETGRNALWNISKDLFVQRRFTSRCKNSVQSVSSNTRLLKLERERERKREERRRSWKKYSTTPHVCTSQRKRLGKNARGRFVKNGRHRNKHVLRVYLKNKLLQNTLDAFARGNLKSLSLENFKVHSRSPLLIVDEERKLQRSPWKIRRYAVGNNFLSYPNGRVSWKRRSKRSLSSGFNSFWP